MSRLRINEVLVVEGKYDAAALASLVDALILTTDGFSIFNDDEKKALLQKLGKERGLVLLTDSDAAGFAIRRYIEQVARGCEIKHAYIPAVPGKEGRKAKASKEGTLGVEGLPPQVLREALLRAGVQGAPPKKGREITYTDLYELGISGTAGSAATRRAVLAQLGLPPRLSKKALCEVLSTLYSYEELRAAIAPKPVLFWDFHATLSLPDITWFDAAMHAIGKAAPEAGVARAMLEREFTRGCLPWWEIEDGDTRHISGTTRWWAYTGEKLQDMLGRCGLTHAQAMACLPHLTEYIWDAAHYELYPDAIPTLRELQRRGYKSYILSNNFPELARVAEGLGLMPYLAGVLVSGQIGYEKPHPGIFAAAKQAAGENAEAWMVGDNPRDDIEGANAAGFTTVAVHGVNAPAAEYQINDLAEILELLA